MSATVALPSTIGRRIDATLSFIQHSLIATALIVVVGAVKHAVGEIGVSDSQPAAVSETRAPEVAAAEPAREAEAGLSPRMRRVLDFVSRRYRVAPEALFPVFEAAQTVAREHRLDPLLIIAIIGIESRFNPFAESAVGAKGLMQVIPGYHLDKVPQGAGELPFLDPVTNIQVGVQVLEEAIRWRGGLTAGLQHYGGASEDGEASYANRVLAEKERLEQAASRRSSGSRG